MVDPVSDESHPAAERDWSRSPLLSRIRRAPVRIRHHRNTVVLMAALLVGAAWVLSSSGGKPATRVSTSRSSDVAMHTVEPARHTNARTSVAVSPVTTTTSTTEVPPVTAATAVAEPSVAELVVEVEAAGIEPGSNWSWSMGDTATNCGGMTGAGTGCTYGSNGLEYSVFSGSPTLALVAHELANAETQNDAVPNLLNEVAAAAAGTSWSPTDAVASCLVAHFMGFQDHAAGTWQCPGALATVTATNIHDSL
jgi:hypothetical protein